MPLRRSVCLLLLLFLPSWASAQDGTLTFPVSVAAADAARLGPLASRGRYLWLSETAREREAAWRVVSGHLHLISRTPLLSPPLVVLTNGEVKEQANMLPADWGRAVLIRIVLDDYGWEPATWNKLGFDSASFNAVLERYFDGWPG